MHIGSRWKSHMTIAWGLGCTTVLAASVGENEAEKSISAPVLVAAKRNDSKIFTSSL
jgi:hypothetical protein